MGTNYYHRTNICECCDRYDEQHICKSMVSFEAPLWHDPENPYPSKPTIRSWAEWKARLRDVPGQVWNEYGERIEVEDFIAEVEATDPKARRRQYDWYKQNLPDRCDFIALGCEWLDDDGFSFYGGAFS